MEKKNEQLLNELVQLRQRVQELEQGEGHSALRESQILYQTLAEALPTLVWTLTPDGTIDYVNQQWREALGVTIEQVNQAGWRLIVHPDDLPCSLENWARIQAGASITQQEYRHRMADGSYRWFLARMLVIRNEQGKLLRVVGTSTDIDERKQLEVEREQLLQQLEASLGQFEAVINSMSEGLIVSDAQGNILLFNRAALVLHEYDSVEQVRRHLHEFPDTFEAQDLQGNWIGLEEWAIARVLRGETYRDYEINVHRLDTDTRWIGSFSGTPVYDKQGKMILAIVTIHDITERKRAELQLQESQRFIQQIADALPGTLYVYDMLDQRNVYINRQIGELLGYTPEQIQIFGDRLFPQLMHPEDFANFGTEIERLERVQDGEVVDGEYRLRHANGEWRWLWSRNTVSTRTPDGQAHQVVGTVHDITERKRLEDKLRESEERYRSLAELIPQLVWTANAEGVLIDVNQRWCTFTGLTLAQAKTEGWKAVVHPDDVPSLGQNWAIAQRNGTYYQAEGRIRRADGVYRWHLHQAVPLNNEQGQSIKWFGTATDIEDQKQLEQQRIHLLQQEQAAREQAETANRIKDEFLAVLSHELRTPLNPILGWTKLLRTRQFDPQSAARALDTIERNAKLQARLIEDLLDVSRILQGKLALNPCEVNLVTTIEAALETVSLSAEAKGIQIQTVLDSEVGQVKGDPNRLQQIVWNLLSNAIEFTPSGGCVNVRLEQIGVYAQIQVSDTGKGISSDFLPHVFEYFRQADSSTTRQVGGLGLGLAIVRHLVELHGGTVKAESLGHGMGATFTIQLPVIASVLTPDLEVLPTQQTNNLNGICILIVDDEADMRDLIRFILEEQGATVMVAASAAEALQYFAESVPDVLISDIGMPEMDGYALMQQIRMTFSKRGKMIPAIALTAYAGDINQRQALKAGFQLHLAKPIEPEQLVNTVAQLVAQSSG